MRVIDLSLSKLREAPWNANVMGPAMASKLRESITRFGLVENLVVRPVEAGIYEVLSGNQRLKVLQEMDFAHAPCVIVEMDDVQARLLAQALNRIQGQDDLGLKAEVVKEILKVVPQEEILSLLPETANSLQALASLGQQGIAERLMAWQSAQTAKLSHLVFQLTEDQLKVVKGALSRVMPLDKEEQGGSPNARSNALFLMCQQYLENKEEDR